MLFWLRRRLFNVLLNLFVLSLPSQQPRFEHFGGESEAIHESKNFKFLEGVFKFGHVVSRSSTALKANTCFYHHQIKVLRTHPGHNAPTNHKLKGILCISNFQDDKNFMEGNTPCKAKFSFTILETKVLYFVFHNRGQVLTKFPN